MSHVVAVELEFDAGPDGLAALENAAARIGMELRRGQKEFKWYGKWMNDYDVADAAYRLGIKPEDYGKCAHALAIRDKPGAFEVGLVAKGDKLLVVYDFWDGNLRSLIGESAGKLKQAYGLERAKIQARRLNHKVEEIDLGGGVVKLSVTPRVTL